jgi:hypothetical protein
VRQEEPDERFHRGSTRCGGAHSAGSNGDLWTNTTGVAGNIDTFVSVLKGKRYNGSTTYKGELGLVVVVVIEQFVRGRTR